MSLIARAEVLQAEAQQVLKTLDLEHAFPGFGELQLIGSARSGLMTLRDIDVMFTAPGATAAEVFAGLARMPELLAVDYRDERGDRRPTPQLTDERFYAVLRYADWKIDITIWIHAVERPHVAEALRVQAATPEEKEAILHLKDTHPAYPDTIGGTDIYTAVLDHGVRRTEELTAYLQH